MLYVKFSWEIDKKWSKIPFTGQNVNIKSLRVKSEIYENYHFMNLESERRIFKGPSSEKHSSVHNGNRLILFRG